ncbi:MAG: sugar-binding protein [Anaerolineales bacterium]
MLDIPLEQTYVMYLSHLLRAAPKVERVTQASRAGSPVQIDGRLDEWSNAGWVDVNKPENILRGAAGWPGAEKASFRLAFLWDAENLYIAAEVLDDLHVQREVGPSVWRGDALWLYFNLTGDRRSIDAKLTLAQTPQGGQVWNWRAQGFQPEARLAWREIEGGYTYEAALSWQSLNYFNPQKQSRVYYDAGMGFGSGGFINWSGLDPDTPSNLLPLDLVNELQPIAGQTATEPGTPFDTALAVAIFDEKDDRLPLVEAVIPQRRSPDRDYLWLDAVFEAPVSLPAGRYRLRMTYAGSQDEQEAVVDAVWILPQRTCKQFTFVETAPLRSLNFCYDWWTGETAWNEK